MFSERRNMLTLHALADVRVKLCSLAPEYCQHVAAAVHNVVDTFDRVEAHVLLMKHLDDLQSTMDIEDSDLEEDVEYRKFHARLLVNCRGRGDFRLPITRRGRSRLVVE